MNTWSWLCSALSIAMIWKMGDKSIWGPIIGLVAQVAWTGFMISTESWGLALGVAAFWLVHLRNLRKWHQEKKDVK